MSDTSQQQEHQPDIASLRARAEAASAAEARNAELERQLLFARAGIDYEDNKVGKMLYKTFEGQTLDELRAEATELGLIGGAPATPPPTNPEVDPQLAAQQQHRQALSGGTPSGAEEIESPDPTTYALERYHAARKQGANAEDARALAFDHLLDAAAKGDERVLYVPGEWHEQATARLNGLLG